MLPKNAIDLLENFARVFDTERPASLEFLKAGQKAAATSLQNGSYSRGINVPLVGQYIATYLEDKAGFLMGKLKDVIQATVLEPYPELNRDSKEQFDAFFRPSRQAAEICVGTIPRSRQPFGEIQTRQVIDSFTQIQARIHADIDLFCVEYASKTLKENKVNQPIFGSFHGIYGSVTNSTVTLHDYSTIYPVLKAKGISQEERNKLEDILDGLKSGSAASDTPWTERARQWLAAHKVTLGESADAVSSVLGNMRE